MSGNRAADDWLSAAPPQIQELVARVKVRDELSKLSDDTVIEPELAAIYLGLSESTLRRMRDGSGPRYVQAKSKARGSDAAGRNQAIVYKMGDLRAWRNENTVVSTMQAAQARGMCFASLQDLVTEQPFVRRIGDSEEILGHALALPLTVTRKLLRSGAATIVWLPWERALGIAWEATGHREAFDEPFERALNRALAVANTGKVGTELLTAMPRGRPKRAPLRD